MSATAKQDLFAEAREKFTIADAWQMLGLPSEPKPSCKSPFRDEKSPSFSIHADGKAFKDHATGDGGDVIEFIRLAIAGDHRDVRQWLSDRIGNHTPVNPPQAAKDIEWPAELVQGTTATWKAFARLRDITYPATWSMVQAGVLRFCKIDGVKCFVITDDSRMAAEIRRMDGKPFTVSKAYPLRGVNKSWMPGIELLKKATLETSVLITEGATDLLAAIDLYSRYRRCDDGNHSWQPVAMLGAGCKQLHPQAKIILKGRHVRLVPDADPAGDKMADHWTKALRKIGCSVDVVTLPQGTDLTDHLLTLKPSELFSK